MNTTCLAFHFLRDHPFPALKPIWKKHPRHTKSAPRSVINTNPCPEHESRHQLTRSSTTAEVEASHANFTKVATRACWVQTEHPQLWRTKNPHFPWGESSKLWSQSPYVCLDFYPSHFTNCPFSRQKWAVFLSRFCPVSDRFGLNPGRLQGLLPEVVAQGVHLHARHVLKADHGVGG